MNIEFDYGVETEADIELRLEEDFLGLLVQGKSTEASAVLRQMKSLSRSACEFLADLMMDPSNATAIDKFHTPYRIHMERWPTEHRRRRCVLDVGREQAIARRVRYEMRSGLTKKAAIEKVRLTVNPPAGLSISTIERYMSKHLKV